MSEQNTKINKGDRNKIFFLTIAIVALLGSNVYLYFKDKHENERFVTVNTEKDRLKLEVEKIEVELDKVSAINLQLNEKLIKEQDLARIKIAELKAARSSRWICSFPAVCPDRFRRLSFPSARIFWYGWRIFWQKRSGRNGSQMSWNFFHCTVGTNHS